jgi:hypothetical protein
MPDTDFKFVVAIEYVILKTETSLVLTANESQKCSVLNVEHSLNHIPKIQVEDILLAKAV